MFVVKREHLREKAERESERILTIILSNEESAVSESGREETKWYIEQVSRSIQTDLLVFL